MTIEIKNRFTGEVIFTFQGDTLHGANLRGANLCSANLSDANLCGADLRGANLRGANLRRADLRGAYLYSANLSDANLCGADLRDAYLCGADLYGANLSDADLYGANLRGANLCSANLSDANLCGADLRGANLETATLPAFQICPEEGPFIAFKKTRGGVIKLRIPQEAKRTSSLVGRKCRAEFVYVLETPYPDTEYPSQHDPRTVYKQGEIVRANMYDDDIRVECTSGIHFFMTRKEAEEY